MNLFENLQILQESVQTMDDLFDDIIEDIQQRFGCDIDDCWYDIDNYPEEFKAQLVLYNISHNIIETIKEMITKRLSYYKHIKINAYKDDSYCTEYVEVAYIIQINAYDDDFNF